MAEQHEKALVPQIRFTGFTDPWEQRKLGKVGITYSGLHGKTKDDFGHGDAFFVPYTNVFDNPVTDQGRLEHVEVDSSQAEVKHGDVFFTVSSETPEEVGMSSIWLGNIRNVYLNSFCFGYRQDGSFDSLYLAYVLRSQSVRKQIELLAQGISRFNISKNKVMNVEVPKPSLGEQRRIGAFLDRLDSLITLHQGKYDKLCVLKKSMLDKMFPKGGSLYPEIRFAGFTDPWEQRKLSSTCEQLSRTINPLETPNEEFTEYSMPAFDNNETAETVIGNSMNSLRKIVDRPCLLVNKLNVRKKRIWHVPRPEANAVCSSEFVPFSSHSSDLSFIKISLLSERITAYLESCSSGSSNSQKRVTPEIIMSSEIIAPSLAEQRRIGAFFDRLDSLITLHQRKLELLRNIKKSMLDKMFV